MNEEAANLDRLHDLMPAPPLPWWPPTPGWSILLAAAVLALLAVLLKVFMRWQADRYRREALAELPQTPVENLSALAKRVALTVWPREEVARLSGIAWLEFLDRSGDLDLFVAGPGQELEASAFHPENGGDALALRAAVKEWILKHRRELPA